MTLIRFAKKTKCLPFKRAVLHTSGGSLTVEAAIAVPFFLFAALCLIYLLEIHAIKTTIRMSAHAAAKQTAEQMAIAPDAGAWMFQSKLIKAAGKERLDRSMIQGGSAGVICGKTHVNRKNQVEVEVDYSLKIPFPGFSQISIPCKEIFLVKGWTGYENERNTQDPDGEKIVYITDTASVYHMKYNCTYLKLSIHYIAAKDLTGVRNDSGGKYRACEKCIAFSSAVGGYYITEYGEKYHSSLSCSGLKRTIYAVPLEEVKGKGGCSKCTH